MLGMVLTVWFGVGFADRCMIKCTCMCLLSLLGLRLVRSLTVCSSCLMVRCLTSQLIMFSAARLGLSILVRRMPLTLIIEMLLGT